MLRNDGTDIDGLPNEDQVFGPIRISVCYEWEKEEIGGKRTVKAVRHQTRWKRLRDLVVKVVNGVHVTAEKRPYTRNFEIRINRLRGRQGMALLPILQQRISRSDIVIVDLGSDEASTPNANVLLELGMAIMAGKSDSGGLFILKPNDLRCPSDLRGVLFAEYVPPNNKTSGLEMPDRRGLDAALRAKLIDLAESRQMIGPPKKSTIEIEDESDESKPHPLGTRKRSRRVAVKGRLKRNN